MEMTVNSQPLFIFVDQFVREDLVHWVENAFSTRPPIQHQHPQGFQTLLGAKNSTTRTRAGEAFRLGIISGRLIGTQKGSKSKIPTGWQSVINDQSILTTLGDYSYLIGKLIADHGSNNKYENALDCLAVLQILHIGFEYEERWYSTVSLYEFARQQVEEHTKQLLSADQLRYLIGALINTLESDKLSDFISAYSGRTELTHLWFNVEDVGLKKVELKRFIDDAYLKDVGMNNIVKKKAALFWAQPRGIYTRAKRSSCGGFLTAFTIYDRKLAKLGEPNILTPIYETRSQSQENIDLVAFANKYFQIDEELFNSWEKLDSTIMRIVRAAIANTDYRSAPTIWKKSLKKLPSISKNIKSEAPPKTVAGNLNEKSQENFEPATSGAAAVKIRKEQGAVEYIEGYWLDIEAYLKDDFDNIIQETPSGDGKKKKIIAKKSARKGKKTDYLAKGKRDKKLGDAGEEFVVHYEKVKLIKLDRPDLAERVVWASEEIGDGLGYDISSFDSKGDPIQIEVKTTRSGLKSPFYISPTELEASEDFAKGYRLYRVFNYGSDPKIYILEGALRPQLDLVATAYRASVL